MRLAWSIVKGAATVVLVVLGLFLVALVTRFV